MFQVRKADIKQESGKEIYLPILQQQDFFQAKDSKNKSKSRIISIQDLKMKLDTETQERIQELQAAEQQLQAILMQKQAFQIELNEAESSLEEIKISLGEMYKITSQIMVKADKNTLIKELEDKKKILNLRLKSFESQEKIFNNKFEKLKKEIEEKLSKKEQ